MMSLMHRGASSHRPRCWVLITLLTIIGCAEEIQMRRETSLKEASSGSVGCAPFEIQIMEPPEVWTAEKTTETWMAACQGRLYHCSRPIGGQWGQYGAATAYGAASASCIERKRRPEPPSSTSASLWRPVAAP